MECARIKSESTGFRNSKQWNSNKANIISCVISFIDSHITLNNWQHGTARVIINCHKRMYGQDMSADFRCNMRLQNILRETNQTKIIALNYNHSDQSTVPWSVLLCQKNPYPYCRMSMKVLKDVSSSWNCGKILNFYEPLY